MKTKTFMASVVLSFGLIGSLSAKAEMIKGLPDAVRCTLPNDGVFVAYISGLLKNGNAVYFSPSGKQFLNITAEGIIVRDGAECHGKSVDELRRNGEAFNFVKE